MKADESAAEDRGEIGETRRLEFLVRFDLRAGGDLERTLEIISTEVALTRRTVLMVVALWRILLQSVVKRRSRVGGPQLRGLGEKGPASHSAARSCARWTWCSLAMT